MKVCTIGLGYIGLPTSAVFAQYGVDVLGVDIHQSVVDKLNRGEIHIEEPGLGEVVKEVVANGKFRASLEPEKRTRSSSRYRHQTTTTSTNHVTSRTFLKQRSACFHTLKKVTSSSWNQQSSHVRWTTM